MGKTELLIILHMWLWGTQECTSHDVFILDRHCHAGHLESSMAMTVGMLGVSPIDLHWSRFVSRLGHLLSP